MNLPSDVQRLLPYVAVAVLAVVGLFLVMRGLGSDGGGGAVPDNPPSMQREATPAPNEAPRGKGSERGDSRPAAPKRSTRAYVSCVEQATDTAALERCQAYLPRR